MCAGLNSDLVQIETIIELTRAYLPGSVCACAPMVERRIGRRINRQELEHRTAISVRYMYTSSSAIDW